jgi:hypothetical protein
LFVDEAGFGATGLGETGFSAGLLGAAGIGRIDVDDSDVVGGSTAGSSAVGRLLGIAGASFGVIGWELSVTFSSGWSFKDFKK